MREFERILKVGNNAKVEVKLVGVVSLKLKFGYELFLNDTFYVPTFRRNLISVPVLDKAGFEFNIANSRVKFF